MFLVVIEVLLGKRPHMELDGRDFFAENLNEIGKRWIKESRKA